MIDNIQKNDYINLVNEITEKIRKSQYEAMKTLNTALIRLYWEIGEEIYKQQEDKGWGKSIVEILSKELQRNFPDIKGFSARNLWNMRKFYVTYKENEKLQPLAAEISWTKAVLINHLENKSYEKFLLNQTNFDLTLPEECKNQAKLAVKDEYVFDFMEIGNEHSERQLEAGLIKNVKHFLAEMGGYFSFIGNQYHISVDNEDFYIDLLLFHRKLKSLIAIELKIGDFIPEYAGKMQFYLTALDEKVKLEDENPSIGIIICKDKKRTIVEYTLKNTNCSSQAKL